MGNRNDQRLEYDVQKRAQAGLKATLRGAVAVYIIYLGYQLVRDAAGSWQIAAGVLFIAAALAFGVFTFRRWRLDLEAARLPDEEAIGIETADDEASYEEESDDEETDDEETDDGDGPAA